MKTLAVIPARAGSKRFPGKNRAMFGGCPLWAAAVYQATATRMIDLTVVSTDDPLILKNEIFPPARDLEMIERPSHLASDATPTLPVIAHAFEEIAQRGFMADVVVVLQPTSPLRQARDIAACLELMNKTGADGVVSVVEASSDVAFEMRWANRLTKLPKPYVPNGAVYVVKAKSLIRGDDWYSGEVYGYVMPKVRSVDVDLPEDLAGLAPWPA